MESAVKRGFGLTKTEDSTIMTVAEMKALRNNVCSEEFERRIAWEDQRMEREQQLFDMKLRILEDELQKFAAEKQHFEQQKAFYDRVNEFQTRHEEEADANVVRGELFFIGVENETSLKKRYKDLIKIYHPDNANGDKSTIQEINNEYQKLRMALEA